MNQAFSCGSSGLSYKLLHNGAGAFKGTTEAVETPGTRMWKVLISMTALLSAANAGFAASAINKDSEPRTLVVTEGSGKANLQINPGETVQFCPKGCFVKLPNGDLEALNGSESIEISGGVARIK